VLSARPDLSGALEAGADEAISKMVPLPEIVARLEALARAAGGRPGT
jgi:DNA-binding response OmpR family regulator